MNTKPDAIEDAMALVDRQPDFEPPATVEPQGNSTMGMLLSAAERGISVEMIREMMSLHERHEANEARKLFSAAMAAFKSETMSILKTKLVDIPGGAKFKHAELGRICEIIIPNLSKHGLRHQWKYDQKDMNSVSVTCVLSHRAGHSEETKLVAAPDNSGKKNSIQQVGSTITFLERYTLLGAVGMAARDQDTDGVTPASEMEKPADFDRWQADARATADEGRDALSALWQKTPPDIRTFVIHSELRWWNDCKAIAERATLKSSDAAKQFRGGE